MNADCINVAVISIIYLWFGWMVRGGFRCSPSIDYGQSKPNRAPARLISVVPAIVTNAWKSVLHVWFEWAREKNSFSLDTWSYADVRLSRQSGGRALYDGADDFFDRPHLTTPVERFVNWNSAYGIFAMISFAFEKKVEPIISPKTSQRAGGAPKLNRYQATFFTQGFIFV